MCVSRIDKPHVLELNEEDKKALYLWIHYQRTRGSGAIPWADTAKRDLLVSVFHHHGGEPAGILGTLRSRPASFKLEVVFAPRTNPISIRVGAADWIGYGGRNLVEKHVAAFLMDLFRPVSSPCIISPPCRRYHSLREGKENGRYSSTDPRLTFSAPRCR